MGGTKGAIKLSTKQRDHGITLAALAFNRAYLKYAKGVKEHGGNLWDMDSLKLIENALDEVADLHNYLETLAGRLRRH